MLLLFLLFCLFFLRLLLRDTPTLKRHHQSVSGHSPLPQVIGVLFFFRCTINNNKCIRSTAAEARILYTHTIDHDEEGKRFLCYPSQKKVVLQKYCCHAESQCIAAAAAAARSKTRHTYHSYTAVLRGEKRDKDRPPHHGCTFRPSYLINNASGER